MRLQNGTKPVSSGEFSSKIRTNFNAGKPPVKFFGSNVVHPTLGKYGTTVKVNDPRSAAIADLARLKMQHNIEGTAQMNEDNSVTVYGAHFPITYSL